MVSLKGYWTKLRDILKAQSFLYFILLIILLLIIAFIPLVLPPTDIIASILIITFFSTFILQSLFLRKQCFALYLLRALIVILFAFKVGNQVYQKMNAPRLSTLNSIGSCIENDSILGFRVKPNQHDTQVTESIGEDTIFSVVFSTDSVSRRIPDDTFLRQDSIHAHSPGRHALFLGCSFTFGHGLMYSSTFPCLYEQLNPGYKSYNYGVPGFGPHQVALLFDQRTGIINDSSLREKGGFALYTYIDDHMNRVYGGSDYLYWWSHATRLIFVEHDSLVIHECSQFQLLVAKLITENGLCRHFGITLQYPHTQTFYKRFADIINYSARKYWELNPDNHFYIGIYPGYGIDLNWTRYLDEKIILLKVEAPADYKDNQEKYYLNKEYDRHPTGIFNVYYTNEITRLIKQYE